MWLASHPGGMGSAQACEVKPNAPTAIAAARILFWNERMPNPPGLVQTLRPIIAGRSADSIADTCAAVERHGLRDLRAAPSPDPVRLLPSAALAASSRTCVSCGVLKMKET